jgi:hypothetical protein
MRKLIECEVRKCKSYVTSRRVRRFGKCGYVYACGWGHVKKKRNLQVGLYSKRKGAAK